MLFVQAVRTTNLKIENPALLAHRAQAYIREKTIEGTMKPPFTCEVLVVLGGNIVKSGDRYITTSYEKGTKKSFGARQSYYISTPVPPRCFRLSHPFYREN